MLRDMIIIALGATLRFSLFFVGFLFKTWFELNKPRAYVLEDGTETYMYPGSSVVYNKRTGQRIGMANSSNDKVTLDR